MAEQKNEETMGASLVRTVIGTSTGRLAQRGGKIYEEVYSHDYTLSWGGQICTTKKGWVEVRELPDDEEIVTRG